MPLNNKRTEIIYGKEFATKSFTRKTMKGAYLAGMKWYATYVLAGSKNSMFGGKVQLKVEKQGNSTVVLHLFVMLEESKLRERHCKICRCSNGPLDCSKCNVNAYQSRADEILGVTVGYHKEKIAPHL